MWQGENISVYNTLTKKNFRKKQDNMIQALYLKLFSCLSGWRVSHGKEGDWSLGVGFSHRVPSADQRQAWDKISLVRKRGSRRQGRKTEAGRKVDPGSSRGLLGFITPSRLWSLSCLSFRRAPLKALKASV